MQICINLLIRLSKLLAVYFQNYSQYVQIEDKKSASLPMLFCVLQGSILGPVRFTLYVTGLEDPASLTPIQYADDTAIY